jgi:GNAT superfamily N-acetyltransferase
MSTSADDIIAAAPAALRALAGAVPGVTGDPSDALAAARRLHALLGAALRDAEAAAAAAAPTPPVGAEASLQAAITANAEAAARAALDDAAASPPTVDAATLPAACREPSAHMHAAAICWSVAYANEATRLRTTGGAASSPLAPSPATPSSSLLPHLRLRYATAADAPVVLGFIRELAEFEREPEAVVTTEATFVTDGLTCAGLADVAAFDAAAPLFHVVITEVPADVAAAVAAEDADAAAAAAGAGSGGVGGGAAAAPEGTSSNTSWVPVAMAFAHPSYSTWEGRTLYLEDLYVSPAYRRRGVSKALFAALARAAAVAGCARLQWSVLTWNAAAVQAYDAMPAARLEDWRLYRLYADGLARVGGLAVVARGGRCQP